MAKIKYNCKNCGWETAIRQEWKDLKPKRCMNKKCNTSFMKNPDDLIITLPSQPDPATTSKTQKKIKHSELSKINE